MNSSVICASCWSQEDREDPREKREEEHVDSLKHLLCLLSVSLQSMFVMTPAYLEPMHEETEESHEISQFGGFEFGNDPRNELRYELSHSSSDGIDELRE